jgi:phosphohistidine phosphatase
VTKQPRMLYLLRHAKSSWADDRLDDHDRPLAKRGEDAVVRLRRHVVANGIAPELVLCSSARRATMTLDGIASAFPASTTALIEAGQYGASSGDLLARLHGVSDDVAGAMLIGHNPGLESLAALLIGDGEQTLRRRLAEKFPTGALATLAFDGAWRDLRPGDASLVAFVVPRDL